ncbi:MAG: c-type cytochrome [Pirellulaceae bacterium]
MRTEFASKTIVAAILVALSCCGPWGATAYGQAVPAERRITHREQSLSVYDPFSADEIFKHIEIPPSPALPPEEALKSFQVAPGFRIECVAAEPLVVDPVMFEFDADGRIWVVEMRGWMQDLQGSGEADPIGQVVVLEDTDGDSFMDRSTVFLDQLVMPRTVSFVDGGVLVAEPPNLWFCRDVDGDLKCDEKRLVGPYGQPGNPEHTDNGLMHALDNWMYNAKATVRHKFHDGKLTTDPTVFRGQWGVTQDDYGRLFYGYENSSLHCDLIPADYVERNAHARAGQRNYTAALNVSLTAEAHEVFPIRVNPGITLGGTELREDGTLRTFTIACGPSIYRGDQFPSEFYGGAIIPEAGGNLVRLNKLSGDGVHLAAHNAFEQRELVASTDERFRPVCSRTGPDGAVYICDLYRGIIEHVIFMMPYLRNQILSRGLETPIGMGRIYRIVHEERPLGPPPRMSGESSAQLVERLSHPNGWWRDTAQRLLVERQAVDAVPALRELARGGESDLGRVHALWTLEGLGQLDWLSIEAGLSASDARLRSTAIRLSERVVDAPSAQESFSRLQPLFDDERPMVQLQLLLTLAGYTTAGQATEVGEVAEFAEEQMAAILVAHPDPVFRAAAVSGLQGRELEMLRRLQASDRWTGEHEDGCGAVDMLAMCVVHEAVPQRVEQLLELAALSAADKAWFSQAIVGGILASNLNRQRWPEPIELSTRPRLLSLLPESAEALQRILTWPGDDTLRKQRPIPEPLTPVQEKRLVIGQEVYNATCYSCHKADGRGYPGLAPSLVESEWVNGSPEHLIRIVLHGLQGPVKVNGEEWNLQMPGLGDSPVLNDERMASVLTYARRAWGNYGSAIEPLQVAAERQATSQRTMPWTVDELLDTQQPLTSSTVAASDALERYRALLADGDAERGRILFHSNRALRCNACHIIGDQGGGFVGPNLSQVGKRSDREHLLESLVLPSAKIAQGFETLVVLTGDGHIVSGTLAADDGKTLVLAPPAGGTVEIAAADIEERIQSSVSSMPPVGETFTPQQIADLVAYLETLKADEAAADKAVVDEKPADAPFRGGSATGKE